MKKWFRYIRFKVLHLKEIIYIQKFWREVLLLKKEKSSIYIKNETYGCDNSYRKNNENLFMTNSEFINSIDDSNSNKNYYKNYKNNKTNIKFSDVFFRNLSNKNLFSPQVIFNSNRNKDNHEDIIKITVNPEGNHTFEYELSCLEVPEDKKKEEKGKHYVDKAEATIDDGNLKVTFYISSVEACVKVDFYFIFKFIQDYKVIFIILLMLFGILNCGFGKRFSRFTAFFLCLFILTVLVLVLSQYILPSGCKEWIIWVMLGVGILLGLVAGIFAFKYHEGSMAFLTGGIGGFILGEFLFNLFGNKIPINGIAANIIVVVVSIIVLIAIAFFFKKFIVIFGTSLIGSYCFIRGISLFAGHFPDEMTVIDLQTGGETEQLKELLTWQVYVYLASIAVATIISMIIQYKTYKEDGETVEGAKDANLMRTAE
jgi:uncharacterized membrane protein YeaQ/YmgE (transglycosylase-associated protein family)